MLHHLPSTIRPLIGKALKSITRFSDSAVTIGFEDGASVRLSVDGDCCSTSIFYEIDMPDSVVGGKLEDIEEGGYDESSLSVTTADTEEVALEKVKAAGIEFWPEENRVWNVVLKTDKGNALIRHINSSNGYYDGMTSYERIP